MADVSPLRLLPDPEPEASTAEDAERPPGAPVPLTPLVGRHDEVAAIAAQLRRDDVRLVTLIGPGGVGKTRLALRVAGEMGTDFPDGVTVVPLAAIADEPLVLPTIAQALSVRDTGHRPLAEQLAQQLRGRRLLLVLDNFEQVAAAAPALTALLATCPTLTLLVTSRFSLRVSGEHEWPVAPLPVPDLTASPALSVVTASPAVTLFAQRAAAANPAFRLTESNAATVATICARLDGLPLAIELAAARVKVLSPAALLARLGRRLEILTSGPHDAPARLQTLRGAIAWSDDLLEPAESALFHRLAIFVGGWSVEAADAIVDDPAAPDRSSPTMMERLASLVDKSLVRLQFGADGETRFGFLETIRDYASEQLDASGATGNLRRRHAVWFTALAASIERDLVGPHQEQARARVEADLDNLRAAFSWATRSAEWKMALSVAAALWPFWFSAGNPGEGRAWLDQTLAASDGAPDDLRGRVSLGAGMLAMAQEDFARAVDLLEPARAAAEASGDQTALGQALFGLGVVAQDLGHPTDARHRFEAALAAYQAAGDSLGTAITLNNLGLVVAREGDLARGASLLDQGLQMHRALGFTTGAALSLRFLGQIARRQEDDHRAAQLFGESLAVDWRSAQGWHVAGSLEGLAGIAATYGQPALAARIFGAAAALRDAIGVPLEPALLTDYDAYLASARGDLGESAFAAAWNEGRLGGVEHAIELALTVQPASPHAAPKAATRDVTPVSNGAAGLGLSPREQEVLPLLARGQTNQQIGQTLGISHRTAGVHVASILDKLGVDSRGAAVALVHRDRLI